MNHLNIFIAVSAAEIIVWNKWNQFSFTYLNHTNLYKFIKQSFALSITTFISKLVFQENKARQIFQKTNIFHPLIRSTAPASLRIQSEWGTAYQPVRNVRFSENLACFVFLKHLFWDSHFCLIADVIIA